MDTSAHLADLLVQIATEEASLAKLQNIKETLQNEVETTWDKLEKLQGVNRKQFKHAQPKEKQTTGTKTNTHCASMSNSIYHGTNMACTSISTRDNVYMAETSVNAEKEHLVMSKSGPLIAARHFMGEFDAVKST